MNRRHVASSSFYELPVTQQRNCWVRCDEPWICLGCACLSPCVYLVCVRQEGFPCRRSTLNSYADEPLTIHSMHPIYPLSVAFILSSRFTAIQQAIGSPPETGGLFYPLSAQIVLVVGWLRWTDLATPSLSPFYSLLLWPKWLNLWAETLTPPSVLVCSSMLLQSFAAHCSRDHCVPICLPVAAGLNC